MGYGKAYPSRFLAGARRTFARRNRTGNGIRNITASDDSVPVRQPPGKYGPGWTRLQERRQAGFLPSKAPGEHKAGLTGKSDYVIDRYFLKFGNVNVIAVEGDRDNTR